MRLQYMVLLTVALAACGSADRDAPPRTRAADFTLREGEQGFILVRGNDTLSVERYLRNRNTLQGEMVDLRSNARLLYSAAVDSEDRLTRLELAFYPEGEIAPQQRSVSELRGDTLVAQTWRGNGESEEERVVTPPGTLLQIRNSVATTELALRHLRVAEGDSVSVPVFLVGRDRDERGALEHIAFRRIARDSMHIYLDAENQVRAEVDGRGGVQGAVNPHNNARVIKLR
jgi:hypothetical protein